jgi:protein-disulfide isomerase
MKINYFKSLFLGAFLGFFTLIASSQPVAAQTTDQIIKQLESSGALDQAVQRSIDRLKKKEELAKQAEAQKEWAKRLEMAKKARKVDAQTEPIYGVANAPITIIEYSDFECPYCKSFYDTPKKVVDDMSGKVNLVWRNFPLSFHEPMASKEAGASICAYQQGGNATFWKYADAIMKNTKTNGQGLPTKEGDDPLLKLASDQGLNTGKFKDCMANTAALRKSIDADLEDGKVAGINGTPGVILINHRNGKVNIIAGALPAEAVKDAIKKIAD